jgi:hypothetical protein
MTRSFSLESPREKKSLPRSWSPGDAEPTADHWHHGDSRRSLSVERQFYLTEWNVERYLQIYDIFRSF